MRIATWIGASFVGFVAAAVLSLFAAASLASALTPGLSEREYVIAAQTLLWLVLAAAFSLAIGRVLMGPIDLPSPTSWLLGAAPVLVSFALVASGRGEGALDIDRIGIAIIVPGALVGAVVAHWTSRAHPNGTRAWAYLTVVVSAVGTLLALIALLSPTQLPLLGGVALATALAVNIFLAGHSVVQLSRPRQPASPMAST